MRLPFADEPRWPGLRRSSRVRVCESPYPDDAPDRRTAIRVFAGRMAALPAAGLLGTAAARSGQAAGRGPGEGGSRRVSPIVRDFADPLIELVRLLREASEIEHALMLQYLYAAASLKPRYEGIVGYGAPGSSDLLGVAIQEMQHLSKVNQFLRVLGAAPNLLRQDFPFEPDIYPFAFNLEPLSRSALAKYVYAEAPAGALGSDRALADGLEEILGTDPRANHIGSLYDAILVTAEELMRTKGTGLPDLGPCLEATRQVKAEGEEDHFAFFRSLFLASHEGFEGRSDIWDLAPAHPDYPARPLPVNPSAYVGHFNQIQDSDLLGLAWLSNLHYWNILILLALGYQESEPAYLELAKAHMIGPLWSLATFLPEQDCGVPFDPLSMGYAPGRNEHENVRFLRRMLAETDRLETFLSDRLPPDYPPTIARESLSELSSRGS